MTSVGPDDLRGGADVYAVMLGQVAKTPINSSQVRAAGGGGGWKAAGWRNGEEQRARGIRGWRVRGNREAQLGGRRACSVHSMQWQRQGLRHVSLRMQHSAKTPDARIPTHAGPCTSHARNPRAGLGTLVGLASAARPAAASCLLPPPVGQAAGGAGPSARATPCRGPAAGGGAGGAAGAGHRQVRVVGRGGTGVGEGLERSWLGL